MKWWLLFFAFIGCVAVGQEDDGSEPFDSGVDDWGFEESPPPKPAELPPPGSPPPSPQGSSLPENPRDSGFNSFGGGDSGGSGKPGAVRFHKTGTKRPPAQKKNWLELKKSLMK